MLFMAFSSVFGVAKVLFCFDFWLGLLRVEPEFGALCRITDLCQSKSLSGRGSFSVVSRGWGLRRHDDRI